MASARQGFPESARFEVVEPRVSGNKPTVIACVYALSERHIALRTQCAPNITTTPPNDTRLAPVKSKARTCVLSRHPSTVRVVAGGSCRRRGRDYAHGDRVHRDRVW